MIRSRFRTRDNCRVSVRCHRIMRIGYPVFVFAVGLAYWFAFRG